MSIISKLTNKISGLSQEKIDRANAPKVITDGMPELLRKASADGAVLLKNDGTLPLVNRETVSLFGRCQRDYFYVGYGSGGDVNRPYEVNLIDGIKNCESLKLNTELAEKYEQYCLENVEDEAIWGMWSFNRKEMPLDDNIIDEASRKSDVAVVVIGRASGEDRDMAHIKGSYYLTDDEYSMIYRVCNRFSKVVILLNIGTIIDLSWTIRFGDKISAILCAWQGGMESGNAVADLLCGKANPCGRLTDTIAVDYSDYPTADSFGDKKQVVYKEDIFVGYRYFETFAKDRVLYPFGYGLSYTDFEIFDVSVKHNDNDICVSASVKNVGKLAGREVVQLYLKKPEGMLGNPARELVGFAKTDEIKPNEVAKVNITVDKYQLCSFDDCGLTNNAGAWVVEKGDYTFYIGKNARNTTEIYTYTQEKTENYIQLKQACAPVEDFKIFHAEKIENGVKLRLRSVAKQKYDLGVRITNNLPSEITQTGDVGLKLNDVRNGKCTIEQFVAQLSVDELEAISRGDYKMDSPLGPKGNAGAFGGVLKSLRDKGISPVITCDGPSGIRLTASSSLLPIGTLLGCTFDLDLVEKIYSKIADEMVERGVDMLLAPGMNIHRHVLCGRNFEYFSEDPFLTGKMASAVVRGVQSRGASACPKHFACNNQEFRRNMCDSLVSERALRQIYLKGFEICINEAKPKSIMTSYNKLNSVYCHYNYDLISTILKKQWGYKGVVITDWWMKPAKSPEFPNLKNQAYRVRGGIDVLMPGGDRVTNGKPDGTLLKTYGKPDGITLAEMQQCAINVINCVLNIKRKGE